MSTKVIHHFPVEIADQTISMPDGAEILRIQLRDGTQDQIDLWALVDPAAPHEKRRLKVYGTGHPIVDPGQLVFLDTVQTYHGIAIFHFFEMKTP